MPERETTPIEPSLWMWPGMMPILAFPGLITPGQFGPTSVVSRDSRKAWTPIMSRAGMPSVMQTTSGSPAPAASMIASAANGGGT